MKKYLLVSLMVLGFFEGFCQDRFEVKKMGFSIAVPKNWIPMENEAVLKNIREYDFTEKQLKELLKSNNSSVNLVSFSKYDPKKVSGIIPTIKIRTYDNETNTITDFLNQVNKSTTNLKKALTDFNFIDYPVITEISNQKVIKFTAQFTLKNEDVAYKIRSSSYYIPKKGYFISLNFIEEIGKEDNTLLFEELVKSIQLTL
ncbi:hypothetical protein [Flavobacterium restrictum]|uniref:PsbP C-terminal domain-containing protein n=1 Tax=Flavobacterium restrictum TaxID=2594428 RepID=A0A553DV52_9FLAO|nr:hypothetical protein [Flavobacterium restrictum]TRX36675.1 hypothetical protein FNW21_13205 [Flavobacterium restrictum]